ncbi:glycerol-3-phosphate dehydrogenase [Marinomonas fungiae]|uniref:Glycerol-3-phosphate dehydrogenase n=1 Tax=Marinomonas fungiae TaxID=1137284 RepID=A0A0K6IMH9_9GAMM|nr:glycerol-3-phosphate dehydrogenase [Marinomonas fungiae]CUB04296.1 homodimeric glycerol 3-phosphate dehydrogenase (quinone) [Marinomonas fungiae]
MTHRHFDLFIVGGGINGAGIAADAAGRGLSVGLCEMNDLASATSSASSKLIHGGLRYLEHYEFRLVREALSEREVLLRNAPHLVTPMRFQMPHRPHLRPAWLIRLGLFLYDHIGKREMLPGSKGVQYDASSPLKQDITQGFEYSDCWVDDARLVIANAMSAREHGALIMTRTRCESAKRENGIWVIDVVNTETGEKQRFTADGMVNAAGPWVSSFIESKLERKAPYSIRMIKGSHIVVPKLFEQSNAFIMQNADKRIVFAIPYRDQYTLIGTTDEEYHGDPKDVSISDAETDYILDVANQHFKTQLSKQDIVWTYSGVRPLLNDESSNASAVTRDYTLHVEDDHGKAPLLSIFGGKITTYRQLALSAMKDLKTYYPNMGKEWTHASPLPGGDMSNDHQAFAQKLRQEFPFLTTELAKRFTASYGTQAYILLADCKSLTDLGTCFGADLFQKEVDYLIEHEWTRTAEDILWRRSKLGLEFAPEQVKQLSDYLAAEIAHEQDYAEELIA